MRDRAVTPQDVSAVARLAGLPLSEDRLAEVASLLSTWVSNANELSKRMQAAELDSLMPSVAFTQPGVNEENVQ